MTKDKSQADKLKGKNKVQWINSDFYRISMWKLFAIVKLRHLKKRTNKNPVGNIVYQHLKKKMRKLTYSTHRVFLFNA